ncbi:hypothetical protein HYQ09_gp244 [Acinetobacter phage vB_AbaM_Konradin]|uniref:Uncharacterized protein n=5 Tax=Lazarusvirus TaxID=2842820 RepID=A0A4Y1NL19_9CAUD|nr:hypothetical protein HYP67_gp242 [Acinetobacter phage vB_ApiM_fHyAci03]YP_009885330.1 hypothetical protein HYQ09_gp244 [Acinetobacter phage vB_AbaM_Konradin]YP_009886422.1 hypothetical protein HYQ21_gp238 [Acinetobacter phage vB_AbaM_Apostate]YP_009886919.1 hypothetical protein HYQ23_gp242 [Acinetobacter phage vB_AbaM_Lazarus]YP_009889781.1 hypothetical protein HYP65_gp242 [Acinetobacter phage AM101]UNI74583.1 hypothetical protein ABNavy4_153 [Acinetobacter phage AB-Navy4]UQS93729.1 hypoth
MNAKVIEFFETSAYWIFFVGMVIALTTAVFGIFMTNAEIKALGLTSLKFISISMIFALISAIIEKRSKTAE